MISLRHRAVRGMAVTGIVVLAFATGTPAIGDPPRDSTPEESQIGRETAADIEHSTRASADTASVQRLNEIAAVIAPRTERPLVHYDVRVIKAPFVNAFSLPGGIIYFTDRLVEEARSDDELAGVMAHEIAHNARQHALNRMHSGTTQLLRIADLVSLGLLVLSRGGAWGQVTQLGVSSLTQSILSGSTIQDEKDADARAIQYLAGSRYSPVGFLTFLEREATLQNQLTEERMGFYRDHPFSSDRVLVARQAIQARGIPIHRRAVGAAPCAVVAMAAYPASSAMMPAVLYDSDVLYFLDDQDTTSALTRRNVASLNRILDRVTDGEDLSVIAGPGGTSWLADPLDSVVISPADARVNATDGPPLAQRLRARVSCLAAAERRRVALMYYLIGSEKGKD